MKAFLVGFFIIPVVYCNRGRIKDFIGIGICLVVHMVFGESNYFYLG